MFKIFNLKVNFFNFYLALTSLKIPKAMAITAIEREKINIIVYKNK